MLLLFLFGVRRENDGLYIVYIGGSGVECGRPVKPHKLGRFSMK